MSIAQNFNGLQHLGQKLKVQHLLLSNCNSRKWHIQKWANSPHYHGTSELCCVSITHIHVNENIVKWLQSPSTCTAFQVHPWYFLHLTLEMWDRGHPSWTLMQASSWMAHGFFMKENTQNNSVEYFWKTMAHVLLMVCANIPRTLARRTINHRYFNNCRCDNYVYVHARPEVHFLSVCFCIVLKLVLKLLGLQTTF